MHVIWIDTVEFLLFRRPVVPHPCSVMAAAALPRIQHVGIAPIFDTPSTWRRTRPRQRRRWPARRCWSADAAGGWPAFGRGWLAGRPRQPRHPLGLRAGGARHHASAGSV